MNVERLEKLAEIVEEGVIRFDDKGLVVVFNMAYSFLMLRGSYLYSNFQKPIRDDTDGKLDNVNCTACLAGLSVLMFGDIPLDNMNDEYIDLFAEAGVLLGLSYEQGRELFLDNLNPWVTGPDAARVIRKLLLTEQVDWFGITQLAKS